MLKADFNSIQKHYTYILWASGDLEWNHRGTVNSWKLKNILQIIFRKKCIA